MSVTFCAGNSPDQMFAAWLNWRRWGLEEHDIEMDTAAFTREWIAKAQTESFLQLIGYDEDDELDWVGELGGEWAQWDGAWREWGPAGRRS